MKSLAGNYFRDDSGYYSSTCGCMRSHMASVITRKLNHEQIGAFLPRQHRTFISNAWRMTKQCLLSATPSYVMPMSHLHETQMRSAVTFALRHDQTDPWAAFLMPVHVLWDNGNPQSHFLC